MIVPRYWAEAKGRTRAEGRQVTVRRFGWSDVSEEEARANAEDRAREALERARAGEKVARREPKVAYNGADGVPIREEIVSTHGEAVVTRNSYGALCLNTADVLFADVDFGDEAGCGISLGVLGVVQVVALGVGWRMGNQGIGLALVVAGLILAVPLSALVRALWLGLKGGEEQAARRRVERFLGDHPDWHARLYRTPAGFRVLAMHQTFDPRSDEVEECFKALGTDRVYARMCKRQRCFRARVSPKPWRVGIDEHLRPRPGVWPISPERMPERRRWVENYEQIASDYAACRFVEAMGSGQVDNRARAVQELHDQLSGAASGLPIA